MVMDFLRYPGGCYRRRVRIHPDDATLYTIRWFFAPEGAKLFPGWHSFASEVWRADHTLPWDGVGEAEAARTFDKGRNHGYAGQCFLGQLEWFDTGMPVAALQQPAPDGGCCRKKVPGGLLLGDGSPPHGHGTVGSGGGLLLDGTSPVGTGQLSAGGLLLDGTSPAASGVLRGGGLLLDGTSPFRAGLLAAGGLLLDGTSPLATGTVRDGGLLLDGTSAAGSGILAADGLLLGGISRFDYYSGVGPMAAYDMVSTLVHAINDLVNPSAVTLLGNYWNRIFATAASTVKLPTPAAGLVVGVAIDQGATAFVTLSPHGTELIDGSNAGRVLWARESAILISDGTNWFRVAGRIQPMMARVGRTTQNGFSGGHLADITLATITLNVTRFDNTGQMADGTGLTIKRTGIYALTGSATMDGTVVNGGMPASKTTLAAISVNGSRVVQAAVGYTGSAWFPGPASSVITALNAGDTVRLQLYQASGTAVDIYTLGPPDGAILSATEVPSW